MRTIDADALLKKVEKIQPWEPYLGKYAQGIRHCMEIVSLLIKDAPTIDPSAQPEPYLDSIVSEIENTISETKESGRHHAIHIRTNGEMICYGLQLALDIIEEKRNGKTT